MHLPWDKDLLELAMVAMDMPMVAADREMETIVENVIHHDHCVFPYHDHRSHCFGHRG
ncbi:hypothetical protein A2U01_0114108, partial [Trifolium medium]|nr:hypothetical protein [Trifolium medium]